jgi:hypothetical protein
MLGPSTYQGYTADEIIRMKMIVVSDSVGITVCLPYVKGNATSLTWDQLEQLQRKAQGT